jgi:phosphoribosyl 1,2-cyclic phosphate phosphodiesterase
VTGRCAVRFLGTGTSHGVPMIGCRCGTCRSSDPRDRRSRPSILFELAAGAHVLVDTTPDLRSQALAHDLDRVDAILFTHCHADHVMGLDEVRRFNVLQQTTIPCYGDPRSLGELRRTFAYIFEGADEGGGIPRILLNPVDGPVEIGGEPFVPVPVWHGTREILGYRVRDFAYLTDCSGIPEASWALLDGVETLAIDALRHRPHPTHFTVEQAVAVSRRIGAKRTWLTHICHDLPHAATNASLPAGVELAYDGLRIDI